MIVHDKPYLLPFRRGTGDVVLQVFQMAKKFSFISSLDKTISTVKVLIAAIEAAGGADGAEILAMLDTGSPDVIEALKRAGAELAKLKPSAMAALKAKFAGTFWDENITDANFPGADPNASIKGVRPVVIDKNFTRPEAIAFLKARKLKPASLDKCILWCAANPDYQRTHWMLCLAQSWVDAGGVVSFVYFYGNAQRRYANLYDASYRWPASHEVLAEEE